MLLIFCYRLLCHWQGCRLLPVGVGLALVLGVFVNYFSVPKGGAGHSFPGCFLIVLAIIFNGIASGKRSDERGCSRWENSILCLAGTVVCIGLILLTTFFQYNATYFATYKESGIRRITLAEHLRKIPLSFFGKKDLADLTSTIMADCTFLEQSFSHFIPELAGSIISTILISIGLLFTDWRMALAALWVLPVAFAIVGFSAKIQENLNQKAMDVKMACADGKLYRTCPFTYNQPSFL